jgi:hypothetical protein
MSSAHFSWKRGWTRCLTQRKAVKMRTAYECSFRQVWGPETMVHQLLDACDTFAMLFCCHYCIAHLIMMSHLTPIHDVTHAMDQSPGHQPE